MPTYENITEANIAICKALHIDAREIKSLRLTLGCNQVPLIEVEYTWHYIQSHGLEEGATDHFTLVPVDDVEDWQEEKEHLEMVDAAGRMTGVVEVGSLGSRFTETVPGEPA